MPKSLNLKCFRDPTCWQQHDGLRPCLRPQEENTTQWREHKAAMTQRLWKEEVTSAAWCLWSISQASQQRHWAAVWEDVLGFFSFHSTHLVRDSLGKNKMIVGEKWDSEAIKAEIISQVWSLDTISTSNLNYKEWDYPCERSKQDMTNIKLWGIQHIFSEGPVTTFLQQHFS